MGTLALKHKVGFVAVAAVLGVAAAGSSLPRWMSNVAPISAAIAQDGTAKGAAGPTGDHGSRGSNAGDAGGRGQGQGGPSADSDAKGPRYGGEGSKPAAGTQGGRPPWAKEGVSSDVELGRLSVARAPAQVLDRSLGEALATLSPTFYNAAIAIADNASLSSDQKIAALQTLVKQSFTDTTMVRIDSPLQNLALYKDVLPDSKIVAASATYDASSASRLLVLTAIFIGSASDKTIPITVDTVKAVNTIMGLTLPSSVSDAELATWAEAVRVAIAEAHG